MVTAHVEYEENEFNKQMNILAWQTSIIINCMGTLKKKIKPKDLFNPDKDIEGSKGSTSGLNYVSDEDHKKLQDDLKATFNL